jgi:carboxylesterase
MASGQLVGQGSPDPIRIEGRSPAVVALHGFGGTPVEVELVCRAGAAHGLAVHAPLLPGHGTHARDLAPMRFSDWAGAAERTLDEAAAGGPAIVAGLSLGSLLALHLALERPAQVRALVLLANALWLASPFPALALGAVDRLGIRDFWMPKLGADLADPEARRTHLGYDAQPVHAAVAVLRAAERLRERLAEVRCPTLVLHGARDRVCPAANARRVAERLGTSDVEVALLPRSRHIVTRDLERAEVEQRVEGFLRRVVAA